MEHLYYIFIILLAVSFSVSYVMLVHLISCNRVKIKYLIIIN